MLDLQYSVRRVRLFRCFGGAGFGGEGEAGDVQDRDILQRRVGREKVRGVAGLEGGREDRYELEGFGEAQACRCSAAVQRGQGRGDGERREQRAVRDCVG